MDDDVNALASLIHKDQCDLVHCRRWENPESPHRQYYCDRALNLIQRLEPVIGIANVFIAVPAVLDELT